MAGDSVTFRLDGELTIETVTDAFGRFRAVLDALEQEEQTNVRWVLAGLEFGSAGITARAEPLDDRAAAVVPDLPARLLTAASQVASADFDQSRPLLRAVRQLTDVADEQHRVILETADDEVIFSAPAVLPARPAPPTTTKSLGTIRGRVETLSHRKGVRFTVYELATDRPVSCYPEADRDDLMRNAWGHIADVTGIITRDTDTGRPLTVRRVTRVDLVYEGDPTGFLRARGAVGGTEPAEQVIRRIRDAS